MACDSHRGRVVLFGGADYSQPPLGGTWEWDGSDWIKQSPSTSPSARMFHGMAYDSRRKCTVLFGGRDLTSSFRDTWEWDGSHWSKRSPKLSPPAGGGPMVFDSTSQKIVLVRNTAVWQYDGTNWAPTGFTASLPRGAVAYDARHKRIVLFGERNNSPETWVWDGSKWTQLKPASSPPWRFGHAMVYDSFWRRVILFGGRSTGTARIGDTWEWDGQSWAIRRPALSPSPRSDHAMVYDTPRRRTLLFGGDGLQSTGQDQTWEYNPSPATVKILGTGCKGSHGKVPRFRCIANPVLGQKLVLDLTDAPPLTPTILILGTTNPNLDLRQFGAPGCRLHAIPVFTSQLSTDAGGCWARLPWIPVPDDYRLLGTRFFSQVLVTDRNANPLGYITTNGLQHDVGL